MTTQDTYTLEEARELDSRPHPTKKEKPRRDTSVDEVLAYVQFWGMFSAPGLVWLFDNRWGIFSGTIAGLFICWIGWYWGQIIPTKNYIIKRGPGLVGVMLVLNSIVTLILPVVPLLILAMVLTPFGIMRFHGEKEE